MKKIVFACGGTLGHINPALAMADYLKEKYEILFISSMKEKNNNTYKNYSFKVFYFNSFGFNRKNIFKNINNLKNNIKTRKEIRKVLINEKVDLVISMGGSIGTLAILEANKLKIKTMLHEQNAVMGLGNKIVSRKVNRILLTYPIENIKKGILIGNPLKFKDKLKMATEDSILIFGGSNGAERINDFFIDNFSKLNLFDKKIVLIVGEKYYQNNYERIKKIESVKFKIIDKTYEMEKYYQKAYIVVCRSGATTLSELINYQKISIVIPSPNVSNNHQYYNALYYFKKNCLDMLSEEQLTVDNINVKFNKLNELKNRNMIRDNIVLNKIVNTKQLFENEIDKLLGV